LVLKRAGLILSCLLLFSTSVVFAQPPAGMDLVTSIGYQNQEVGPYFLIGAKLVGRWSVGDVGIHFSNVIEPHGDIGTVTVGLEGTYEKKLLPFYIYSLNAKTSFRQYEGGFSTNLTLLGKGTFGNLRGHFNISYIGNGYTSFPWDSNGMMSPSEENHSMYYAEGGVAAMIFPELGIRWTQDIAWKRSLEDSTSSIAILTGPEVHIENNRIALQGGVVIGSASLIPYGRVTYFSDSEDERRQIRLSVETASLDGKGLAFNGTYQYDAGWFLMQALMSIKANDLSSPKVYFSIQPRL
jgi:hypothetical protein